METNTICQGRCEDVMSDIADNSVDLICSDPPYAINMMGKNWDKALPSADAIAGCLRVLKPGAFAFVMASARQDVLSRMMVLLEDVGFDIGFTSIYWAYSSGFPKAMNIGKKVDKRLGVKQKAVGIKRGGLICALCVMMTIGIKSDQAKKGNGYQ